MGAIAAVVVFVPNHTENSAPAAKSSAPPKKTIKVSSGRQTGHRVAAHHGATRHGITRADRRAIDATLDKFIPAAVGKESMATAWRLAGPELKSASTRKQWLHGATSVPYFPVAGKKFHGWTTLDATPNAVEFDLLVEPRPHTRYGSWVFSGEVIRRHSHWLVNRLYPTAMMRPVRGKQHEIGTADFGAPAAVGATTSGKARLSGVWLLAVAGLIGLAFLFPIGFGITSVVRNRHRRSGTDRALPPLPERR